MRMKRGMFKALVYISLFIPFPHFLLLCLFNYSSIYSSIHLSIYPSSIHSFIHSSDVCMGGCIEWLNGVNGVIG